MEIFESLEEQDGDIIRIDRLIEFLPAEHWKWDRAGEINLDDISVAIHEAVSEISDPYGDTYQHPVLEQRSREWHIGRIIYFINHPMEIKDIEIDNECNGLDIFPQPVIIDGWHRYIAARWLYDQGKLDKIHCRYGGREDLLLYLKGETDEFLNDIV